MRNIEFKTKDHIFLRGWLYIPHKTPAPAIVMTPGFSALKEHFLAQFAEYFVSLGFCVLVYDHRNFGASDGAPRLEVDPVLQAEDMRDAMTFLQTFKEVDPAKINLWGTSFSAGVVLHVASCDERVSAAVLQVPFVQGHHPALKEKRPDIYAVLQKKYRMDEKNRMNGGQPIMTPVVTNDPQKSAIMKEKEAYDFFTSVTEWRNEVTLRSIENSGNYSLLEDASKIRHAKMLFIVAKNDTICATSDALLGFEKLNVSKKLLMIDGHHFSPYTEAFEICARAAGEWFSTQDYRAATVRERTP